MSDVWPPGTPPMDDDPLVSRLRELRWPEVSPEQAASAWDEFERSWLQDEPERGEDRREAGHGGRTALPPTADRRLMARTFAYLYGLGATLVLIAVAAPHPPYRSLAGMLVPPLIAYGVVALMLLGGQRQPLWLFRALPILGTLLISSVVLSSDAEMVGVFWFFYFWPALSAFYFFGRRWAAANLACVGAAAAVVLALEPHASHVPLKWTILMWLLAAAAVLVLLLREHVEGLVGRLALGVEEITAKARELSHSHALTRSIIETAHEAFISVDDAGAIREWNAEAERIFGRPRDEVLGCSLAQTIFPPQDRAYWEHALIEPLDAGRGSLLGRRIELTAIRQNGAEFPVEATISALPWGDGYMLNAFLHDISERKRAEREAAEYTTRVEAIEEATRQIARGVDPRAVRGAICDGARKAADAVAVMLFEPSPDGRGLVATASAGAARRPMSLPFTGPRSAAVSAFTSGEPVLVRNLPTDHGVERELASALGVVSGLWQPIDRGGSTIAVLAMLWPEPVDDFPTHLVSVIGLLADRAAIAIARSEVLLRLEEIARTDVPTGLPNHRAWEESLARELARARREERSLTVALINVDRFNDFLETHMPPSADRLLKELTSAWTERLRPTDTLARYSEGQFALAVLDCSEDDTSRLLKRLRDATPSGRLCSMGVARWNGKETGDELMTRVWAGMREREQRDRHRSVASADGGTSDE